MFTEVSLAVTPLFRVQYTLHMWEKHVKWKQKYQLSCSKPVLHQEKGDCTDFVDEDKKMNWTLPIPGSY